MAIVADLAQTFFIDKDSVKKSQYAFVNSIKLYFLKKPTPGNSSSGLPSPGVTVYITDTENNNVTNVAVPRLFEHVQYGKKRLEYNQINTSANGLTATEFIFEVPVPISTDTAYAIVIKFDGSDRGFSLWRNKAGETYNNIQSPAITKGALDGYFFSITNGTIITPQPDVDLKFELTVSKFSTSNTTYKFVNRNFEIIKFLGATLSGTFIGGEYVFANTGFPAGQTVSVSTTSKVVTGTSTKFLTTYTNNSLIILNSGTSNDIRKIVSISSDTSLTLDYEPSFTNASAKYVVGPVGKVFDTMPQSNLITLVASTANLTHNFLSNGSSNTLIGVTSNASVKMVSSNNLLTFNVDEFTPRFEYFLPPGTNVNTSVRLANSTYSTQSSLNKIELNTKKRFTTFPAKLYSRSAELLYGNGSVGLLTDTKSLNFYADFSTSNEYVSPLIDEEDLGFLAYRRVVNNDLTNEHKGYGNAFSKYVSKRITLAPGQDAEDIRVYVTAFRPFTTDVKVYVKFYNELDPKSFENRDWTLLDTVTPNTLYSNPDNFNDYVDLEYKLFNYPVANTTSLSAGPSAGVTFIGENGNSALRSSGGLTVSSFVTTGDLVRVYSSTFANNSLVSSVISSNSTHMTLDVTLDSANTKLNNFVKSGLIVEKCTFKNMAYNNFINDGILRYYNSDMSAFDTFNTFAFKVVLTGISGSGIYPLVQDIRAIALSI